VLVCKVKSLTSVQYLIQIVAHVIISICYVVMFLLHVSALIGRLQGSQLKRNVFIVSAVTYIRI
jgi:hypothetical protein